MSEPIRIETIDARVSPHWDNARSIREGNINRKIQSGDIIAPDNEALRKYSEELRKPVPMMVNSLPLTEELASNVLYRRAQMLMFIKTKRVETYEIDEHNRSILRALKLYAMRDERFETEGHGDLHKGILLAGLQGCGKTMMLKMIADAGVSMSKHDGRVTSIKDIKLHGWGDQVRFGLYNLTDFYSCVGIEHEYRQKDTGEAYLRNLRLLRRPLVFDDLGFEKSETMNYGNRINIMEGLIQQRYDMFIEEAIATHFSTNLVNFDEVEKIYGTRVRSRIREMCNVFFFDTDQHKDRRK